MEYRKKPWTERFWPKVDKTEACWLWTAAKNDAGYGQFRINRKTFYAHRLSYELAAGAVPDGLVIDHLCRVPLCVNPDHLEAVPQGTNVRRGIAPCAITIATNRCHRGHDMSDAITVRRKGVVTGQRCRECQNESSRARYAASRGASYKPRPQARGRRPNRDQSHYIKELVTA